MIPLNAWEPLALVTAASLCALVERREPGVLVSDRIRDLLSWALAIAVSAVVRGFGSASTSTALRPLRIVFAVAAFDLLLYGMHRFGHGRGWRMHHAHHLPAHFGVAMAFRDSMLHLGLYVCSFVALERGLGLSGKEAATVSCVFLAFQCWTHARVWVRLGPLDRLFIGPRHHFLHHATPMKVGMVNLGGVLCLWDQIFGTYLHPSSENAVARTRTPSPRRAPGWREWMGV